MDEYKKPYLILWKAIDGTLTEMDNLNFGTAKNLLRKAQIDAEEAYIEQDEE